MFPMVAARWHSSHLSVPRFFVSPPRINFSSAAASDGATSQRGRGGRRVVWTRGSRWAPFDGEPELSFFKRQRNSLVVYPRFESGDDENASESAPDFDAAVARHDNRIAVVNAEYDHKRKAHAMSNAIRHTTPTDQRQLRKRTAMRKQRAQKLLYTLKYLLAIRNRGTRSSQQNTKPDTT